jgi:recombination protein RecT
MSMANENALVQVQQYFNQDNIKSKFENVLRDKAPQFMASITNAIRSNASLQNCDSQSIISSALVAATYDLPIDSNLGFSAIVPYYDNKSKIFKAQFQMMYKGFVQLAVRSGAYENMNVSEVYEDELIDYNPITGELQFTKIFSTCKQRKEGKKDKVVGYYAWFKLLTGFKKELFMNVDEVRNHAMTYSSSYKKDLEKNWTSSKWSTDFEAMAKKTVLKLLLSRWGILTIDMQRAIQDDQKVYDSDGTDTYTDNPDTQPNNDVIDPFAVNQEEQNATDQ